MYSNAHSGAGHRQALRNAVVATAELAHTTNLVAMRAAMYG